MGAFLVRHVAAAVTTAAGILACYYAYRWAGAEHPKK